MNPRKAQFTELVHMTGRYQVYICHIWSTARFLAFLVSAARLADSVLDWLRTPSIDQKPADSRLGPAKVPQPCVDLVNVTAPARSLA
jgi:hypothetical protein